MNGFSGAHLIGALFGGTLGFAAALFLVRKPLAQNENHISFARPATDQRAGGVDGGEVDSSHKKTVPRSSRADGVEEKSASAAQAGAAEKLSQELHALRAQEVQAQKELVQSQKRIAELERELGGHRERNEFDLTPEDWRSMGQTGGFKYRVPCSNPKLAPSEEIVDKLGLAPDDRAILVKAYENSAQRLRQQVLPLCAKALGNRMDLAEVVGSDACVSVILSTARGRGEDRNKSARRIAAVMAGDAKVSDDFNASDLTLLAFAEEAGRFEAELADAFGPEEAHRIAFSSELCFSKSIYALPPSSGPPSEK